MDALLETLAERDAARLQVEGLKRELDLARRYGFCRSDPARLPSHVPRPDLDGRRAYCASCGRSLGLETLGADERIDALVERWGPAL